MGKSKLEKPQFLESMSILMAVCAVLAVLVGRFSRFGEISALGSAFAWPLMGLSLLFAIHHVGALIVWHRADTRMEG